MLMYTPLNGSQKEQSHILSGLKRTYNLYEEKSSVFANRCRKFCKNVNIGSVICLTC